MGATRQPTSSVPRPGPQPQPRLTQPRLLVSLATYNERDNLTPLVAEIHQIVPAADILVIDDNSADGTGALADQLADADRRIHVIHRPAKLGLGTAILAAMRYAIDRDYDMLVNMDADFSHHPRYLPALLEGMKRYDVMIGSRYVAGGGTVHWPWSRRLMSAAINLVVRLLMRMPIRDSSGGFRAYHVRNLRHARLDGITSRGYSFQQEVLHCCRRAHCRIGETPILFEDRRAGATKANLREILRSTTAILYLGVRVLFGAA